LGGGEKLLSHRLARLGGGRLAIGEAVTIHKGHRVPEALGGYGSMPYRKGIGNMHHGVAAILRQRVSPGELPGQSGQRPKKRCRWRIKVSGLGGTSYVLF